MDNRVSPEVQKKLQELLNSQEGTLDNDANFESAIDNENSSKYVEDSIDELYHSMINDNGQSDSNCQTGINCCPHCGSTDQPIKKVVWNTYEKAIAIFSFIIFFPAAVIFLIIKHLTKKDVCPKCNLPYEIPDTIPTDNSASNTSNAVNAVKTVVKNPEFRSSIRNLKSAGEEFADSLDINK